MQSNINEGNYMNTETIIIVITFLVRECYGSPKKQEFKKNLKKFIDQPV